ncbi:MAG TPA: hypothetical protein VNQ77_13915 [Frankiaceae bacterium]|nr:hypothetical protein [Frankiaceae bacterium]
MSLTKTLAAAAAVSLLLGVSAAEAAKPKPKKPVCNIVKDAKDDATGNGSGIFATPNEPTLDIVSADVATNANMLTAVFRLAALEATPSTAPTGRMFNLTFTARGTTVTVDARVNPVGNVWNRGKGSGIVDPAKKEVRLHVPFSALPFPLKANEKITNLRASSWRWGANQDITLGLVDDVQTKSSYVHAWPSCVKVGK